jgi:hypothetical protein
MYFIALMMEAADTSETLVDNCFIWQYIPEDKSEFLTKLLPTSLLGVCWLLTESSGG